MPPSFAIEEDPFFEDAISDLEDSGAIRRVVEQVDVLAHFATSAEVDDDRRRLARRQLQAEFERERRASRNTRMH